jgi:hypothetical protein
VLGSSSSSSLDIDTVGAKDFLRVVPRLDLEEAVAFAALVGRRPHVLGAEAELRLRSQTEGDSSDVLPEASEAASGEHAVCFGLAVDSRHGGPSSRARGS